MTLSLTSELFSTDDFAQSATFWVTSGSGAGTTAKVVFDSGENVSAFGESQFDDQSTFVYVQDSEVTGIDKSSVLEIDSTVYFVTEISSDGTGVTLVRLTTGKVRL